ncbi:MAG: hypothetical protein KDA91_17395 [Planctomycetaceae bacterium]|nr:hypothetical protein [Planctomycetaceae bacterium]
MKDVTTSNFGLLIAFVLPGFVLLWGIAPYSQTVTNWLAHANSDAPTVGGFLYATLASVGLGQLVSTLRWLLIDSLHHRTGITPPKVGFASLKDAVGAFDRLIEIHYRYYQWHANALIAATMAAVLYWFARGLRFREVLLLIAVDALLYVGSRDTLTKYYRRVDELLRRDD